MRLAILLILSTLALAEDIRVSQPVSTSDRVLIPMGQGAYQLLAPGVGDVRSITTYYNQHTDTKVVVIERVIAQPVYQPQPVYQQPQYNSNPIILNNRDDCGGRVYEYEGGNPFNKDNWKRK